ncbi:MAG: LEA type 2 family protein [Minicystis sp.]
MLSGLLSSLRSVAARGRDASTRIMIVACAVLALALSTGCSPVVTLHHTEVRGVSGSGVGVVAVLEVENENSFDVEIRRVSAHVTVAGRYRMDPVDIQPNKWIPAGRKVKVAVPLNIPWTSVPGVLAETVGSSEVSYRVVGTADITAGRSMRVKQNHYPIDQEGSIPRSHLGNGRGGGGLPLPIPF